MNINNSNIFYSNIEIKPEASRFEKFQFWMARKVVIEKSRFWSIITQVFKKILPYFTEIKQKLETKRDGLEKPVTVIPSPAQPVTKIPENPTPLNPQANPTSTSNIPSETLPPEPTQDPGGITQSDITKVAHQIDATVAISIEGWAKKPVVGFKDPMQPIRSAWNLISSLCGDKSGIKQIKENIQQYIETDMAKKDGSWLEKEMLELTSIQEKIQKGEADQQLTDHFQNRIKRFNDVLNTALPNGEIPVHFAARLGKVKTVQRLLELGANPISINDDGPALTRDRLGNTVLDYVSLCGNTEMEKLFSDYFKKFFNQMLLARLQTVMLQKGTLSQSDLQSIEDEVKTFLNELIGGTTPKTFADILPPDDKSKKNTDTADLSKQLNNPNAKPIVDHLGVLPQDQTKLISAAFLLSMVPIKLGLQALGRTNPTVLNFLTSMIAVPNSYAIQFGELAQNLGLKGVVTFLTFKGVGWFWPNTSETCSKGLNILTTSVIALSYFNLLRHAYKDYNKNPKKAITAVTFSTLNILMNYYNFFGKFVPEVNSNVIPASS